MRIKLFFFSGTVFASVGRLVAGPLELQPKEIAPPTIAQSEPWHFTIAAPGWMAGLDGTIGVRGINADIDIGFDKILRHLDGIFAVRAEAQKGPFGIYGELIYLSLSDSAEVNGLVQKADARVDQYLVDGALSWRLINKPRGSLDLVAGTHYFNLYERIGLQGDSVAITEASEQFVTNISDDLRDRLNKDISNSEFIAALQNTIQGNIANLIDNSLGGMQTKPNIPIGPLAGRLGEDIAQVVQNLMQVKEAALRARIDALKLKGEARRAAVDRIVNATKARITQDVSSTLMAKLNQTFARGDYWFDPYIGLRGRYNFNKTFYTAVRGEIGGFGVGADLMWEIEGVVGINLTRCVFTEIGYRALGADYENDGLLFDAITHGPQITTGITF